MVISSLMGTTSPVTVDQTIPQIDSSVVRQVENRKTEKEIDNIMSTEQYVRQYFNDIPIMIEVARCESHFRQLDSDGEIHRGQVNPLDVGVMQINEHYHLDKSIKDEHDIYTLEGNTAYARDLYDRQGTGPWNSSKPCWGKYLTNQPKSNDLALNTK